MREPTRKRRAPGRDPVALADTAVWHIPRNSDRPTEPLDAEGVAALHAAAMRLLSEVGVEFPLPEALAVLRREGCRIDGQTVRMEESFVMAMLARAPRRFAITPRNPAHALPMGDDHIAFGAVASLPNIWDLERGRRVGDAAAFRDLVRLGQAFPCIHFGGGYPVEPMDIPAPVRHLDCLLEQLLMTDKVVHAYTLGPAQVEDAMEMVRLAAGLDSAEFAAAPRMHTNINSVSPLRQDALALDGAMRLARAGQAVLVTPYTIAGATAPSTIAGAVAQSLAEGLSVIALLQAVRPGAPVVLGSLVPEIDARSGGIAFGSPRYLRATQIAGQMARLYGLPLRSSGACASPVPDSQAMWETSNSLWAAVQSGSGMVYHAAGWLEGGVTASAEKFVLDCELLEMMVQYFDASSCAVDAGTLSFEAIQSAAAQGAPAGGASGVAMPFAPGLAPKTEKPMLAELRGYDAWDFDGGIWPGERAHRIARRVLAEFEPPAIDSGAEEALRRFVADRKQALVAG